jgi:hypothetical protein
LRRDRSAGGDFVPTSHANRNTDNLRRWKMGAKLLKYYDDAKGLGGAKATMRMAMITGIPSAKAGDQPDSPELVKKFEDALATIKKEA